MNSAPAAHTDVTTESRSVPSAPVRPPGGDRESEAGQCEQGQVQRVLPAQYEADDPDPSRQRRDERTQKEKHQQQARSEASSAATVRAMRTAAPGTDGRVRPYLFRLPCRARRHPGSLPCPWASPRLPVAVPSSGQRVAERRGTNPRSASYRGATPVWLRGMARRSGRLRSRVGPRTRVPGSDRRHRGRLGEPRVDAFRSQRQRAEADARGVVERVGQRGSDRVDAALRHPLRPQGADGVGGSTRSTSMRGTSA